MKALMFIVINILALCSSWFVGYKTGAVDAYAQAYQQGRLDLLKELEGF